MQTYDAPLALSDRTVSYLRTVVPTLWGALVATVLRAVSPHLPGDVGQALADLLGSELALTLAVTVAIAAWYWLWRRLERRVPDWLVRLVLGSSRAPGYALPAESRAAMIAYRDVAIVNAKAGARPGGGASVPDALERRDVEPDDDTDPGDDEPAADPHA